MFFKLPKEIVKEVFSYLDIRSFLKTAQTNKFNNQLSKDDSLWKGLVKRDFHFTEETFKYFFQQHPELSYMQLYQHCQNDEPSEEGELLIASLIDQLRDKGLTEEHLKGRPAFCQPDLFFYASIDDYAFKKALVYLMTERQPSLSADDAVATLLGLTANQALGIALGLSREQVLRDNSSHNIQTLQRLKPLGLTGEQFLELEDESPQTIGSNEEYFGKALIYLMTERDPVLSAKDAIKELRGLNRYQALGIALGLTPEEANSCISTYYAQTLAELKLQGMTFKHLLKLKDEFSKSDSEQYDFKDALIYLMKDREPVLSAADAVAILKGLKGHQAWGVKHGLTYEEAKACVNLFAANALLMLKPLGLTHNHVFALREEFSLIENGESYHMNAILYLMRDHQPPLKADDAVRVLQGKTSDEAKKIVESKITIVPALALDSVGLTAESTVPQLRI